MLLKKKTLSRLKRRFLRGPFQTSPPKGSPKLPNRDMMGARVKTNAALISGACHKR